MMDSHKEAILAEIIERELAMFLMTPNEGGPSACQQRPAAFKIMRQMSHCSHDDAFLASYLDDLRNAEAAGRNFMIEKYARMDDRLPPLSNSPLLDEIADAETAWMEAAANENPDHFRRDDASVFRRYLRCELETLSPKSLQLYAEEIRKAKLAGCNMVLERYNWLEQKLGQRR